MEAVQFRINDGVLEYRALIIQERDTYPDGGGEELWVNWQKQYTEWAPLPNVSTELEA